MTLSPEISVLIPEHNEAGIIANVIGRVHLVMQTSGHPYEIIVVDDGSIDDTAEKARSAGARVVCHPYNIGNGAAMKTAIRNALGDVMVMMDGDGQHTPEEIPLFFEKIGSYDMVVGARNKQSETAFHRDIANQIYNWLASYISGRKIEDLTSGFRAIKANVARSFVYLLPNTFSYPTTITLSVIRSGFSLAYVPITTRRRVGKSKIKLLRDGLRFLLIILKIATFFAPLKVFVPVSLAMFLTGFGYGLFKVFVLHLPYGPTTAMLMTVSILVFLIGLVSEQITQLRFDRSDSGGKPQQD